MVDDCTCSIATFTVVANWQLGFSVLWNKLK